MNLALINERLIQMGLSEAAANEIVAMVRVFGIDCAEAYKDMSDYQLTCRSEMAREVLKAAQKENE